MKQIKIKCPAKINLDLRVFPLDKKTGFHSIKSIMQTIGLFDFITIKLNDGNNISLFGTSDEIPYDEKNICYKAAKLFFEKINKTFDVSIFIEKNIPVCAGLAGGSTDGAGVLYGLNKILDYPLTINELHELAQKLGSDLNFCLEGGTVLCTGRGEILTKMPFYNFKLSLVKPKHLKIAAKEAYQTFDLIKKESNMRNDLEFALLESKKYPELEFLSSLGLQMSGSGPTYFLRDKNFDVKIDMKDYLIINDLNSVSHGVVEA